MIVMALAFKVEHGVNDVLQRARPRDRTFLRDVADEEDRNAARLCQHQELRGDLANLRDRSGR